MTCFRHAKAIPQYDASSGPRIASVSKIEQRHKGLILAGNLRDGIGMAQRITQATTIARMLADQLKEQTSRNQPICYNK